MAERNVLFDPNQSIDYIVSGQPLAPETLRLRVAGTRDPASFVRLGSSAFARLQQVLGDYCSKEIADLLESWIGDAVVAGRFAILQIISQL